jgi:intracellular multiplication protein IcmO
MAAYKQRGLDRRHEQDQLALIRDTRSIGQRIGDFLTDPMHAGLMIILFGVVTYLYPCCLEGSILSSIGVFWFNRTRPNCLPFRLPRVSHAIDDNDREPGTNRRRVAKGITFLGNDRTTQEELWLSDADMRTHMLIFGSTGSGKTVALTSIAYNALVQASGFIYIDGKGDNSLFANIFSMVRSMGREDDLLLINFMTGARDIIGPQSKKLSNTMNPFAIGSSSMLSQLVVNLMDGGGESSDGDMWKGRAIAFVEALMKILVYMRDTGNILLDANTIRHYFHLPHLETIAIDKLFPRNKQESVNLEHVPDVVVEPIQNYLSTLPGFDRSKKGRQGSQTLEQHGYITMQLTRVFTSLSDTYGHILRVKLAEVDLKDVVLNRRILVVLLPALEKSPSELSNLGKVIVSSLKAMMSTGLGSEVEGTYTELIKRKPTNSETPFLCIMDEYGYYAVEGFAVVPAQARSLGFSVIFAGQDLPAFQKASKEEAASIGANTNIKIAMKLEDPTETWEFFSKTAGESLVTKVDSFQSDSESMTNSYRDTRSASTEKRARVDLLDLKEQTEGQAHIFFKSQIIRAQLFGILPPPVQYIRLNDLLLIDKQSNKKIEHFKIQVKRFFDVINKPDLLLTEGLPEWPEEAKVFFQLTPSTAPLPIDCYQHATQWMASYLEKFSQTVVTHLQEELDHSDGAFHAFMPLATLPELVHQILPEDALIHFKMPIFNQYDVKKHIDNFNRLIGVSQKKIPTISNTLLSDIKSATYYPPDVAVQLSVDVFITWLTLLQASIERLL